MTVFLLLCSISASISAAKIPFNDVEVLYELQERPLADFLQGLFASQGLPLELSPAVVQQSRPLNGPRSGTPEQVFASIAQSNQLIAYYDGSTVYVYKASERLTRYLSLPPSGIKPFMRTFNELRLGDQSNVIDASADRGLIAVTGTWRFVEQVEQLANAMRYQASAKPQVFRYFPLRYALAGDTNVTVGNREVTVPGVATVLQLANGLVAPNAIASGTRVLRPSARRLRGTGLDAIGDRSGGYTPASLSLPGVPPSVGESRAGEYAALPPQQAVNLDGPNIIADPYRNAIIVRDEAERMAAYEELIRLLDVEPLMVEIEATIIDVDRQRLRRLGVDWRIKRGNREFFFSPDGRLRDDLTDNNGNVRDEFVDAMDADDIDLLGALSGLNLSSILGSSTRIASRINLLSDADVLSIVSRPQVLTLNDTEAIIESSSEVYVPVGGTYEVDLFQVIAGTLLRVTPHVIVEADGRNRIRMQLTIEDGNVGINSDFAEEGVPVPLVTRNAVNTQALLEEGQSLLIGGLVTDRASYGEGGVPGLRRIPIVKRVFSRETRSRSQRERLFLITPRLVPSNRITGQMTPTNQAAPATDYLLEPEIR